jgi:lipoprotein-anchoring transpeptidase ErfK/SrfK
MKITWRIVLSLVLAVLAFQQYGCQTGDSAQPTPTPSALPTTPPATPAASFETPLTMPLLDAFFHSDERFAADLQRELQLSSDQVNQLREQARRETAKLREQADPASAAHNGSTVIAANLARQQISELLGAEKFTALANFVIRRWQGGSTPGSASPPPAARGAGAQAAPTASPATTPEVLSATAPYRAPADTRLVVNAPAYRMDLFEQGQLVKSYQIAIGYPEFPLPTGLRQIELIIINPTWTPPDEPWVEASGKVQAGKTVAAGSKLNPLGVLKIPIGLPSLIHGGKTPRQIGSFGSHGCVGLTDKQAQDLAKTLATWGGVTLTDEELLAYQKNRTKTQTLKLAQPILVELRYETIVVGDGKLQIYRDVYERGTNTPERLHEALAAYGVTLVQLSEAENAQIVQALEVMSRNAHGTPVPDPDDSDGTEGKSDQAAARQLTRTIKGEKELVIPIAALAGKGYPAPAKLITGSGTPLASGTTPPRAKPQRPRATAPPKSSL